MLVAGLGNIFRGDDAFGCEVAQRLARRPLPAAAEVVDFGIRGIDLSYALLDGYDAAIMIDSAIRGGDPGTVSIVVPERSDPSSADPQAMMLEPHSLDPAKVLRFVDAMGGGCRELVLVACEPATFGDEQDGAIGLSPPVADAVEHAVAAVERLIDEYLETGNWTCAKGEPALA